jgi:hypothetical protein
MPAMSSADGFGSDFGAGASDASDCVSAEAPLLGACAGGDSPPPHATLAAPRSATKDHPSRQDVVMIRHPPTGGAPG